MDALILNRQHEHSISVSHLKRFASRLLQHLSIPDREFSLLLTNDCTIRRFNRDFRSKDNPTDILSFPLGRQRRVVPDFSSCYLGDIIISVEKAQQQALERKHSLLHEIKLLMIHGLLHLLGYDHERDQGQMRRKELKIRRELL